MTDPLHTSAVVGVVGVVFFAHATRTHPRVDGHRRTQTVDGVVGFSRPRRAMYPRRQLAKRLG